MMRMTGKIYSAAMAALVSIILCHSSDYVVSASSFNEPHPHQGVVTPFESSLPNIKLDQSAHQVLSLGKPYQAQAAVQSYNDIARTMLIQDVHAPVEAVMDRILDYNNYNRMVPNTLESEIYQREAEDSSLSAAERLGVRLKAGAPGLTIQFFCNVLHEPAKNMVTWTLDYSKKSDVHDSVGYWYVEPHPDNPAQWSRVHYSTELSLFSWVPKFIADIISKSALFDAVAWVKKHSEAKHRIAQEQQDPQSTTPRHIAVNEQQLSLGARLFARREKPAISGPVNVPR